MGRGLWSDVLSCLRCSDGEMSATPEWGPVKAGGNSDLLYTLALRDSWHAGDISCALMIHGGPGFEGNPLYFLLQTVDLSSWREKIARDVAGASWGNVSGEEEEEEDGPAVLVEQQTDSAMEPTGPSRERYKDGVVTIGCVGKDSGLPEWPP